jgi:excisionase family DNA binding protein
MSADNDGTAHTAEQVATRLGVSLGKVYGLLKSGELGHYRIGDRYLIPTADLAAYIARVYVPAKPEGAVA